MRTFFFRELTRAPWFADLSLELSAGEIGVVTGPSGVGKSLLLRSLADLDPVDSGVVGFDSVLCQSVPPQEWRRQVLYLAQTPARFPGTVRDNLEAVARLDCHKGRRLRAPLPDEADASTLSGGESQKLALHRAIGLEPEVLLLDEPTSALDEDSSREAERQVLEYVARGHAALWVSHDSGLCSRLKATHLEWREWVRT